MQILYELPCTAQDSNVEPFVPEKFCSLNFRCSGYNYNIVALKAPYIHSYIQRLTLYAIHFTCSGLPFAGGYSFKFINDGAAHSVNGENIVPW